MMLRTLLALGGKHPCLPGPKADRNFCPTTLAILALAAWLCVPWSSARADETLHKKVLIIGIDGCRPDALLQAKAPHLRELMHNGAFSDQAQTGDITISGPGWSSMLTGVWRDKHGIRDNKFEGANFQEYPHFFRRLKAKHPQAFTASIVHWGPINERIVRDADLAQILPKDSQVAEQARRVLRERDPDALFVHFDEVDGAGHKHGFHPTVAAYVAAIEQTDAYVGQLVNALRDRKDYVHEDWLILVSTDHGGSDKGHGKNIPEHPTIFMIVSGPSAARGRIEPAPAIVDVAATALRHLGVETDKSWHWDGRPVGLKAAFGSPDGKR
jgi:predicted AlkP superfamily pyrophosphatase or phosphodiesterase